jgi:cytidine deaminase
MVQKREISFTYLEVSSPEELGSEDRELLGTALKAAENAYAPYSGFRVGAALRLSSGIIVTGANVENAAFPSGICAERNVISNAVANHPGDKPVSIAITALTREGQTSEPVAPCGNCRQAILEEETRNGSGIRLILGGRKKILIIEKGGDLVPLQFSKTDLGLSLR